MRKTNIIRPRDERERESLRKKREEDSLETKGGRDERKIYDSLQLMYTEND